MLCVCEMAGRGHVDSGARLSFDELTIEHPPTCAKDSGRVAITRWAYRMLSEGLVYGYLNLIRDSR